MQFVIDAKLKGNKREVPGNLPLGLWWELVDRYQGQTERLVHLPWHHEWLEYLTPDEMARTRAKAQVWEEVTGVWPTDIAHWWEIRMARRRGDIPHMAEMVESLMDEDGGIQCGHCGARWNHPHVEPWDSRCKLCDRRWLVVQ